MINSKLQQTHHTRTAPASWNCLAAHLDSTIVACWPLHRDTLHHRHERTSRRYSTAMYSSWEGSLVGFHEIVPWKTDISWLTNWNFRSDSSEDCDAGTFCSGALQEQAAIAGQIPDFVLEVACTYLNVSQLSSSQWLMEIPWYTCVHVRLWRELFLKRGPVPCVLCFGVKYW